MASLRAATRRLSAAAPRIASRADHGPIGNVPPVIATKRGIEHVWADGGGTLSIGGACSEAFSGAPLARILAEGHEYEKAALDALAADLPAPALVQHTAAALPSQYAAFVSELETHLPAYVRQQDDWCMSLQVEGASAVMAAVELLLHLQQARGQGGRVGVAVADRSYHGPPSTSLGVPAGKMDPAAAGIKPHQIVYPAPTIFRDPSNDIRDAWDAFFAEHGSTLGCVVVEPQWGSSCAAAPWDPALLAEFVERCRAAGALVVGDEIMCGLGRHGKGTFFLTDSLGIEVDCLTFGKAVAGGSFPMAGAVLTAGAAGLRDAGKKLGQSHTYAASSPRALLAATATLRELPAWTANIQAAGDALGAGLERAAAASRGKVATHGLGLMRGAVFDPMDSQLDRVAAAAALKKRCREHGVWPYFVPAGGVMCTPHYNVPVETVVEACDRLVKAFGDTAEDMGW